MLDPHQTMDKIVAVSKTRAARPVNEMIVSALLGGAYLSLGGCLFVFLGGGTLALQATLPGAHSLLAASVFPMGLSMIVLTGADLLTSNM